MLQLVNHTPFSATLAVFSNPAGVESAYGMVKATFDLTGGEPHLAVGQAPLLAADVYWGDPTQTSLRAAADVTLLKPSTDIIVAGRAVAPEGKVKAMDLQLTVGPVMRSLRVFGDRTWTRNGQAWTISDAQPFDYLPLLWELAFGGSGAVVEGKEPEHEPRNPVGRGFIASHEDDFEGALLPNIEDPAQLIAAPHDRPAPVGWAPVAPVWMPRRAFAGTYDEAWQKQRAPFLPVDFDSRYFNVAAPQLTSPAYLQGGEEVELFGCTRGDSLQFALPRLDLALVWHFDGAPMDAVTHLDTVLIEPDQARLQMVWRAELAVDKKLTRLKDLTIRCRQYTRQAAA